MTSYFLFETITPSVFGFVNEIQDSGLHQCKSIIKKYEESYSNEPIIFKSFLYLVNVKVITQTDTTIYFYYPKYPKVDRLFQKQMDIENDIHTLTKQYDLTRSKYGLALTSFKPATYKLIVDKGNNIMINKVKKFITPLELHIFTDINNTMIKSVDICSNCEQVPTGKKKSDRKCCRIYDPKNRVRRKMLLDTNVILNIR